MQHARSVLWIRPDTANRIGFDDEQSPAADVFQIVELAGFRDSLDAVDTQIRLPEVLFILPTNETSEIDSDGHVVRSLEVESGKRNRDRCRPAIRRDVSVRLPNPVPIRIIHSSFVRNKGVELRAERISCECVPVALVIVG